LGGRRRRTINRGVQCLSDRWTRFGSNENTHMGRQLLTQREMRRVAADPSLIFTWAYASVCVCVCVSLEEISCFKWVKVRLASYYCLHSRSYIITVNCIMDRERERENSVKKKRREKASAGEHQRQMKECCECIL